MGGHQVPEELSDVISMGYWENKVVVITGASAGFGRELATAFVRERAKVALVARDANRLDATCDELGQQAIAFAADVTSDEEVARLRDDVVERFGRVDVLVNCVGKSGRKAILDTTPDDFRDLFELNFLTAVRCTRAFSAEIEKTGGHLVFVGSLASKTASRFLGAYPASKFPLAAYAQQLRLELTKSIHVLLVCPGPIARSDAGTRYEGSDVPAEARKPGGGVKLKGISPESLAKRILKSCERRDFELTVPSKARLLFVLSQISARLGDWLVSRMTK